MTSPRWARALLAFVAPPHRADDVVGDLEESHRARLARRGAWTAGVLTTFQALDVAAVLLASRLRREGGEPRSVDEAAQVDALSGVGISLLDFKLAVRMLLRFPGLTVVASVAIAFTITIGAGTYEFFSRALDPVMPFEEGDRIVELWNRDRATGKAAPGTLRDFVTWRDELESFEQVGAWHSLQMNLVADGGAAVPRGGAAVTADLLAIPKTPPLLGRLFSEADQIPGAPEVVILGHDTWRAQFSADPDIVGERVHVGSTSATVVGVMPDGFGWPLAHQFWMPIRIDRGDIEHAATPSIAVAARLAPGVAERRAEAEFVALGARMAADPAAGAQDLHPEMTRFGAIEMPVSRVELGASYTLSVIAFLALLALVCGNVALLLFARTAARESEVVVRSALGASRGRIVSQLGVEALLLGGIASVVGLWGAGVGLQWMVGLLRTLGDDQLGFWFSEPISVKTRAAAVSISLAAAALSGVIPAWQVTSGGAGAHLKRAGTLSERAFGRLWATVIVAQIAVTVAFVPLIVFVAVDGVKLRSPTYGFPAEEYLGLEIGFADGEDVAPEFGIAVGELRRRLDEDPAVQGVAVSAQLPGTYHRRQLIEIEGPSVPTPSAGLHRVSWTEVDASYFHTLGVAVVEGRGFGASDFTRASDDPPIAIVNEAFVLHLLGNRNPIGRRFRFRDPTWQRGEAVRMGPWYEIVGVTAQIAMTIDPAVDESPGYYLPIDVTGLGRVGMSVHVGREPQRLGPRVRSVAAEVSPRLLITDVRGLDDSAWQARAAYTAWFWVVLGAGGIGVLLATVGIHSIMAFTVARRTREIGVRVALGADRKRVVSGVFSRAFKQVASGIALGSVFFILVVLALGGGSGALGPPVLFLFGGSVFVVSVVCGLACIVPTARALSVEPSEALRSEA